MERQYTVMTVTHGERYDLLRQNIESVADQLTDGEDITVRQLVFDNASTDCTPEYLRSLQDDSDFRHVSYVRAESPVTAGAAYNHLAAIALQDAKVYYDKFCVPLDSDDLLERRGILALDRIRSQSQYYPYSTVSGGRRFSPPGLVFGAVRLIDEDGRGVKHPTIDFDANSYTLDGDEFMRSMWIENRIVTGTAAIQLGILAMGNCWDESPGLGSNDWSLWANILAAGTDYYYDLTRTIAAYRQHDGQISHVHEADGTWGRDAVHIRQSLIRRYGVHHRISHFARSSSEWYAPDLMSEDMIGIEMTPDMEKTLLQDARPFADECLFCEGRHISQAA